MLDFGELARTARLLLVGVGQVDRLREIFAIGDLRRADIGLDLELALHAVDEDLEVELAHPLDDRLARFMVAGHAERRILASETIERDAHLLLVGLGLGLHRDLDDGIGEFHPLEDDRGIGRAQRIAGGRVLETRQRDDVARIGDLDVLAVVGMHQQHAADLFLLVLDRVRDLRRGLELARIDAREGQRADERVVHDLERQRREGRVVRRRTRVGRLAVHLEAFDRRNVQRAGQIVDDGVEQRLDALVLERRAAQHGHEREVERALADQLLQRRDVGLLAAEVSLHDVVVLLDGHLDELLASGGGGIGEVGRDFFIFELRAEALVEPDDRAILDQVDEALEAAFDADREIEDGRTRAEAILDHVDAALEARAGAVELVDEAHPRDVILLGLAPHGFRLRLDAGNAVEAGDRAVEHAERTLDFDGEVDVARGVDDVDAVLFALALVTRPETGRRGAT